MPQPPCVVGTNGVEEVLILPLNEIEERGFRNFAAKLTGTLASLKG